MINNFSLVVGLLLRSERKKNHITSQNYYACVTQSVCLSINVKKIIVIILCLLIWWSWTISGLEKKSCWWGNEFFFHFSYHKNYYYYYQKVKVDQRKLKLKLKQWSFTICRGKKWIINGWKRIKNPMDLYDLLCWLDHHYWTN